MANAFSEFLSEIHSQEVFLMCVDMQLLTVVLELKPYHVDFVYQNIKLIVREACSEDKSENRSQKVIV